MTLSVQKNHLFHPRRIYVLHGTILLLCMWVTFQGLLTDQLKVLPRFLSKIDEFILIFLFFVIILDFAVKHRIGKMTGIYYALFFVLVGAISFVLNDTSAKHFFMSIITLFQYMLIYPLIVHYRLPGPLAKKQLKFLFFLALSTVPMTIWQFATNGGTTTGINEKQWDNVVGPFFDGCANVLSYFCGFFIIIISSKLLSQNNMLKKEKRNLLLLLLAFCIPLFLSSGKSAYLSLFIVFLSVFFKFRIKSIAYVLLLMCVFAGIFWFVSVKLYNVSFYSQIDLNARLNENMTTESKNMGRILYTITSQELLNSVPWGNIIGIGPGMYSSYPARTLGSAYLTNALIGDHTIVIPSMFVSIRTEYGYLGYLLFVMLIWSTFTQLKRIPNVMSSHKWAVLAQKGCALLFILSSFAENSWETQVVAFYFWLISGLLFSLCNSRHIGTPEFNVT
jgi:hypothetical protein